LKRGFLLGVLAALAVGVIAAHLVSRALRIGGRHDYTHKRKTLHLVTEVASATGLGAMTIDNTPLAKLGAGIMLSTDQFPTGVSQ
jgi:hypothetical protein